MKTPKRTPLTFAHWPRTQWMIQVTVTELLTKTDLGLDKLDDEEMLKTMGAIRECIVKAWDRGYDLGNRQREGLS